VNAVTGLQGNTAVI